MSNANNGNVMSSSTTTPNGNVIASSTTNNGNVIAAAKKTGYIHTIDVNYVAYQYFDGTSYQTITKLADFKFDGKTVTNEAFTDKVNPDTNAFITQGRTNTGNFNSNSVTIDLSKLTSISNKEAKKYFGDPVSNYFVNLNDPFMYPPEFNKFTESPNIVINDFDKFVNATITGGNASAEKKRRSNKSRTKKLYRTLKSTKL